MWSEHDVQDLAADLLASEGALVDLASGADDFGHLKARIEKALVRRVIGRLRAGPVGVLRRRIERRLARREDVIEVRPRHLALPRHAANPHWGGPDEVLEAAAAATPVDAPPPWSVNSPRRAPVTTTQSIDTVCTSVLDAAAAPVGRTVVLTIVSQRIEPVDPEHVVDRPDQPSHAPAGQSPEELLVEEFERAAAVLVANEIWERLSDDDRALLPFLDVPSREVERRAVLTVRKSAIEQRQKKLQKALGLLLDDVPDRELVAAELLARREQWAGATGHVEAGEP